MEQRNILRFIFYNNNNRIYLLLAILLAVIQFAVLKYLYPFPDFISDSYSYINTNLYNMKVNLWPIGYSKFLALIHLFTTSHVALVAIQYMILELSLLFLFYSVSYLFQLSRRQLWVLFAFLFVNPMFVFLANCVLSDALFCPLSVILFTHYIWILRQPRSGDIWIQAVLISAAFVIRYTAIYYPIASIAALALSNHKLTVKLAGMVLPWVFIVPFILYTQQKTKEVTGTAEFSVFGGWQLANNALYMYEHISIDTNDLPEGTHELNRAAHTYFATVPQEKRVLESVPGTFFMKVPTAVLKPYMYERYYATDAPGQFKAWGMVSPVYKKFGSYLIRKYPFAFARYYLWLNTKNYFIPYLEKFGSYNIGMRSVYDPARIWFEIPSNEITLKPSIAFQEKIFSLFPTIFMLLNWYFLGSLLYFAVSGRWKVSPIFINKATLVATVFLSLNFAFSVFATPVVLRYQIVPMIVLVGFSLLLHKQLVNVRSAAKAEPVPADGLIAESDILATVPSLLSDKRNKG